MAQLVKNLPAMQETWVRSLDWEDPLEKGMASHSSILAWRIPQGRVWKSSLTCIIIKATVDILRSIFWHILTEISLQEILSSGEKIRVSEFLIFECYCQVSFQFSAQVFFRFFSYPTSTAGDQVFKFCHSWSMRKGLKDMMTNPLNLSDLHLQFP